MSGQSSNTAAAQFERELEIFRRETDEAAQFLYAYLSVHQTAARHPSVYDLLNSAALFWNTNLGALQTAGFISLGRIFDQNSQHNVDRLLRLAQNNLSIFSTSALAGRKQGQSATRPDWLDDYLKTSYVPTPADFRRLRSFVSRNRKVYDARYRDIRHKWFAHKEIPDAAEASVLFANANIRELELLVTFLGSLHDALWELFYNGRKPILRRRRYSVTAMHKRPTPMGRKENVHERITHEVARFLRAAAATE